MADTLQRSLASSAVPRMASTVASHAALRRSLASGAVQKVASTLASRAAQ